jgi:LPXTG-motif cell wall-anchored protein
VANLEDGDHVVGPFGTDLGQTADVVLALSSTSSQLAARDAAAAYLAAHVDDYVHGAAFADGSPGSEKKGANYAGPTGKAIVAALAAGQNPRALGGFDLVAELQDLMVTSGSDAGRFSDDSAFGDFSNPLGQAFDIIALQRTTGAVPESAVRFLLTAQCPDGGFTDAYPASPQACTSNPDATGLALQALVAVGVTDADSETACAAGTALAWLASHDSKDGSYASGAVNPTAAAAANVNSTAYAALGLTAAAESTAAQTAYLASVQNADGGLPIVPTSKDATSNVLATAQALNALTGSTFLSLGSSPLPAAAPACTPTPSPTATATTTTTAQPTATSAPGTARPGGPSVAAGAAGTLPRTGANPFEPALAGLALVLVGGLAVVLSRRRLARQGARQR